LDKGNPKETFDGTANIKNERTDHPKGAKKSPPPPRSNNIEKKQPSPPNR